MSLLENLSLFSEDTLVKPYRVREFYIEHEDSRGFIDRLSYCYVKMDDHSSIYKHGERKLIEKYYEDNKDKYKKLMDMDLKIVHVPKHLTYLLNICINISGTNYPDEAAKFINSIVLLQ